ncbi:MAG: DUF2953 domain-containing protein [Pseudomonadota bacterium]
MSILFWSLGAVALVLFVMFLVVLSSPVIVALKFATEPRLRLQLAASPLGGAIPFVSVFDSSARQAVQKRRAQSKKKRGRDGHEKKHRFTKRQIARVGRAAPRFIRDLISVFRIKRFRTSIQLGLADPADTGQLLGLLAPLTYAQPPSPHRVISVRPNFDGAHLSGEADIQVRFVPFLIVPPTIRFAWRVFGVGK